MEHILKGITSVVLEIKTPEFQTLFYYAKILSGIIGRSLMQYTIFLYHELDRDIYRRFLCRRPYKREPTVGRNVHPFYLVFSSSLSSK